MFGRPRHRVRKARERRGLGGGYVADAVHFDGDDNTLERAAALTGVADSPFGIFSFWRKAAAGKRYVDNSNFLIGGLSGDQMGFYAESETGENYSDTLLTPTGFNDDAWHHLILAWDTNHAFGERIYQCYLDDAPIVVTSNDDSADAYDIDYTGGNWALLVGGSIFNMTDFEFDAAELFFAPGQFLDLSVEANRRKFISAAGKPVDLGADGSTPTGTAPAVFFSGDSAGFATNKGTGGAFVLTGSLTNALTSPSD